jgi:hypothetical protein
MFFTFGIFSVLPSVTGEMREVRELISNHADDLQGIQDQISDILDEAAAVRGLVPPVLEEMAEVRGEIPPILDEAAAVRALVPSVLEEMAEVREQIPLILDEVAAVREQIPPMLDEVAAVRQQIPPILVEVRETRADLYQLLDQAEQVVVSAEGAGRKASEGAVTGIMTGIIKAPFSVAKSLGRGLFGGIDLTNAEMEAIWEAGRAVLDTGIVGETRRWENKQTQLYGYATLKAADNNSEERCSTVNFRGWKKGKEYFDKDAFMCLKSDGSWELQ